ncbi:proline dehydrogenase family protein [Aequorivita vladivostokensis]|jgi:proline dehydrogenase|uniref:Proline dehydrogenase n=1 Tax=Aequorivita vladivostokensis TaxID=171194 RepID=A0ABR5DF97_9FLAO|nr:proline dehydrogenase family protein [Aequorivita vladivostokensis]KJJ37440.1 proline dehydrogenase [Aequorivita vladivostokensis]MAB58101.1 proline dehydrogenase [Aequorivita sp.]MAO47807.1 proline dehydrogenase [Aequorivita sp.]MBF30239.1 proline dehydrogenase [Aequorivita sp.]|tara:strand:- start:303454 stop:304626 length:1173 start_codon:yes stop_codon:yes gene_type:complete
MASNSLFDNTETAFQLKSDSELERAYFLFKMISMEPLVRIGSAVTKFALNVNLPVEGLIRSTVFDHFCGGVNERDCMGTVDKLYDVGVSSVLDFSVEGKEEDLQFDATAQKVIELTEFAENKEAMPFSVFKPTGLGRFKIWQKITEKKPLTESEQVYWENLQARYDTVSKAAHDCGIRLLIDAEESWMQDAADDLCEKMMEKYNIDRPIVFNTLQCYRWDRLDYLKKLHQRARTKGYKLGFKIVRGAYLEKENERAIENGYKSPICESKKATDDNFNEIMKYILDNIEDIEIFVGTHNETSTYLCMDVMKEKGIAKSDDRVWFGQLYGMSDHITFNLGAEGYNVAKYIPFGPVKDVMPYLIRRAEENTSVAGQTSRELTLLKKEKARRKL